MSEWAHSTRLLYTVASNRISDFYVNSCNFVHCHILCVQHIQYMKWVIWFLLLSPRHRLSLSLSMLFFRIIIIIRGDWTRIQHSTAPKLLNVRRLCRYNYSLLCETFFVFSLRLLHSSGSFSSLSPLLLCSIFFSVSFIALFQSPLCLFHSFILFVSISFTFVM